MPPFLKKILGWTLCIGGGLLALVGAWAIGAYIWGVIDVLGDADQSWIFWGLALLFIGLGAGAIGALAIRAGRVLLKKAGSEPV